MIRLCESVHFAENEFLTLAWRSVEVKVFISSWLEKESAFTSDSKRVL